MSASQNLRPHHSRISFKILLSERSKLLDFGEILFWLWGRRNNRRLRWRFRILAGLFLFFAILWATHYFWMESREYLEPALVTGLSLYSLFWAFEFGRWGLRSHSSRWRKIFNLDTWASFTTLAALDRIFFAHHWTQLEIPETPHDLAILTGVIFCWILLRILDARFFSLRLSSFFKEPSLAWSHYEKVLVSVKRFDLGVIGAGLIALVSIICLRGWPHPLSIMIALFPLCLPYSTWLTTWLLKQSEQAHYACNDFTFFKNLRKLRLLILHQFGVLSEGRLKLEEAVIDADDEWGKDEIKDILFRITEDSHHPVAKLIHKKYISNKRSLISIERLKIQDHLGIEAEIKDLRGSPTIAILGGMTWHKVLQHEIFPETLVKLKEWKEKKYKVILLALNRKILALFALSDPWREDLAADIQSLKNLGLFPVMMTSNEDFVVGVTDPVLERAVNLVPVERQEQVRYWLEREPRAAEIVSYWDAKSTQGLPQIHFSPERDLVETSEAALVNARLKDLGTAISLSRSHRLWRFAIAGISFLMTAVLATLVS